MSPREQAFSETYGWLDNGSEGPAPQPPEGLHPLALDEWHAGVDAAQLQYTEEETTWAVTENFIVWLTKVIVLMSVAGVIYWIHEPWSMVIGGFVLLRFLKRWL